jgi:uncharacterized membrane protein YjfL (UPF0719 family)
MNTTLLIKGLIELGISFCASILVFYISFKFFAVLTKKIDDVKEIFKNNIAVALLAASFLFGIMICIQQAVNSSMDNLSIIMSSTKVAGPDIVFTIIRILVFFILSGLFSFLILWLALVLFTVFTTRIDEWAEIRKNNSAISLILGVFLVITALFLSKPLATLLDGLIPPPMILPKELIVTQPFLNTGILIRGAIELIVTLAGVFLTFFFSFTMFKLLTKKIDEQKELLANNLAMSFLLVSFIIGIMILFQAVIEPSHQTLYFALDAKDNTLVAVLIAIGKILVFFIGTAIASFLLLQLSMRTFMLLFSKKDELDAIKKNNVAVSLVVGVFIIAVSFIFSHGMGALVSAFVSTPKIGLGLL